MSNFDSAKKNKSPKENKAIARWSFIKSDLGTAASEWSQSENTIKIKTQDEEQFDKVKSIIENLKDKLNEF